jgi:hypothetical protein
MRGYSVLPGDSWTGVGSRDASTAGAANLLTQAGQQVGQATLPERGEIAGSDVSAAQEAIRRAQGYTSGADPTSPEAQRARQLSAQRLETLGGPDRDALANRTFSLLRSSTEPAFQNDQRNIGRSAAAFGRIGSGVTNTNLADLQTERERLLAQEQERLSVDSAQRQMDDRLSALNATLGAGGAFAGEDLARANFGLNRSGEERAIAGAEEGLARRSRDEQVGERDFASSQDAQRAQLALSRAGMYSGLSDQTFGQGSALRSEDRGERDSELRYGQDTRNEYRDERDYQNILARYGVEDQFRDRELDNSERATNALYAFMQGNSAGVDPATGGTTTGGGTGGTAGPVDPNNPTATTTRNGQPNNGFNSIEEAQNALSGWFGGGAGRTVPTNSGEAGSLVRDLFGSNAPGGQTSYNPDLAGRPVSGGIPSQGAPPPQPSTSNVPTFGTPGGSERSVGGTPGWMTAQGLPEQWAPPEEDGGTDYSDLSQYTRDQDGNLIGPNGEINPISARDYERYQGRDAEQAAEAEIPSGYTKIGRGNATTAANGQQSQDADFWYVRPDQVNSWYSSFGQGNPSPAIPGGAQYAGGWTGTAKQDGPATALGTPYSATDFDWLSRNWQGDPKLTDQYMRELLRMASGG